MKIFSFLGHSSCVPEWTYAARGSIWRVVFSQSGTIIGESRDHEKKTVSFFAVDEQSGSVKWQDVQLQEPWWLGIDTVYRDVVILHEFANPGLPEHRGIIALDIHSGTVLWQNREVTFWFAYKEHVYAYKPKFDKRIGFKLSLRTGELVEEYEDALEELHALRKLALDEQQQEGFFFPERLEDNSGSPEVAALVREETQGIEILGDIEFIHRPPFLLLNYYIPGRMSTVEVPVLENRFSVYHIEKKNKIFSDTLAKDAKAPTPDSFFLKGSLAFYIKGQNLLTALRLQGT